MASGMLHDHFRRPGDQDAAAAAAAFGAEIDDPVAGGNDVEVVLDDHQ